MDRKYLEEHIMNKLSEMPEFKKTMDNLARS